LAEGNLINDTFYRANARLAIFFREADYAACEQVRSEAVKRDETRRRADCLSPNHLHLPL